MRTLRTLVPYTPAGHILNIIFKREYNKRLYTLNEHQSFLTRPGTQVGQHT